MERLWDDVQQVAEFGSDGAGVTRLAWTRELMDASCWVVERARALGLDATIDPAGNVVAKWGATGAPIVVGSHLDTVPRGGRFDGALGVLSGLAAIRSLKASRFTPSRPIWLAAFMDEEGVRFGAPMFGSHAFVGDDLAHFAELRDIDGLTLPAAMEAAGFSFDRAATAAAPEPLHSYLELHIEQGPTLERDGCGVGVVTNISGSLDLEVAFAGVPGHAGTTPMDQRRDALAAAARAVLSIRDRAMASSGTRATVGTLWVSPGAGNVIPGRVVIKVDVRATQASDLERFSSEVAQIANRAGGEEGVDAKTAEIARLAPVAMAGWIQDALIEAADREKIRCMRLPSGAGHDAMVLGRQIPAGMLFVPSRAGISHSPAEYTTPEQCVIGARVLARALRMLASSSKP